MTERSKRDKSESGLRGFYRHWLRWYPSEFRGNYGAGMEQMFWERLVDVRRRNGRLGVAAFLARESWSVALAA